MESRFRAPSERDSILALLATMRELFRLVSFYNSILPQSRKRWQDASSLKRASVAARERDLFRGRTAGCSRVTHLPTAPRFQNSAGLNALPISLTQRLPHIFLLLST